MSQKRSGVAIGFTVFAAAMLMIVGSFGIITGLAAIFEDSFYAFAGDYILKFDVTAWGWIHLILGVVVLFAGLGLLSGATWARVVGVVIASLSAIANFASIPYYPVWSIVVIGVDVVVIWALTAHGRDVMAE